MKWPRISVIASCVFFTGPALAQSQYQDATDKSSIGSAVIKCLNSEGYAVPVSSGNCANPQGTAANQAGIWQVTPTLTSVSTMTLTGTATAYTPGQLVANNATAGSVTNPSFTMPTLGGAIPRLRLASTDTTSTAWSGASVQIDLWSASPTWTNGDHAAWLPLTGTANHLGSFSCTFPTGVWGDGLATECTPTQGNYVSIVAATVYWSVQATSGSGVLGGSKTLTLRAELN